MTGLFDLLPEEERAQFSPAMQHEPEITKWDIFHYTYAMLHHPQYRERYEENLRRDLPRIPLVRSTDAFQACAAIGSRLMDLHLHYEEMPEYPLKRIVTGEISYRIEKMHISAILRNVVVNDTLTLADIPAEVYEYQLGSRSALEWIIDQYQITTDERSGIASDPNKPDDPEYIVRLVCQVVYVSVETVRLVRELEHRVNPDEWTGLFVENAESEMSHG